jgi:hypothetical protein
MKPTKTGQFAMAISERLAVKDWDMADLSRRIDVSYEFARKLVKGLVFPSRELLNRICEVLELDREKMWGLAVADKIKKKYGSLPSTLTGKEPRFAELEPLLPRLTQEQFETMLAMVEVLANRNRTEPSVASTTASTTWGISKLVKQLKPARSGFGGRPPKRAARTAEVK